MDTEIKPSWLALSEHKLAQQLLGAHYPPPLVRDIISKVRSIKAEQKAAKTKATVAYQLWDDLLKPARTELATVRVLKTQTQKDMPDGMATPPTQAKYDALCIYETVLVKVIGSLRKVQQTEEVTPVQFAAMLRKNDKKFGAHGDHWTHYVKQTDRRRVELAFEKMPHPSRGKKKVPFEYKIAPEVHDRLRRKLHAQIVIAQDHAEQEYEMATDPDEKARLSDLIQRIQEASYRLDIAPRTAPLPATWEGLIK